MRKRIIQVANNQAFMLLLFVAVLAAILFPEFGSRGGPLKTDYTTDVAIFLIFFIQGLALPTRQILHSAAKFRFHAYCQFLIFAAAPLIMLGLLWVFDELGRPELRWGFFFLSALPTTISSSVVLTASADGDSSTALFSTTLASLLGIFLTPLLCSLFIASASGGSPSLVPLIAELALLVLLPLIFGQVSRPWLRNWADQSKSLFKRTSNGLIIFIVFCAFSESALSGIWTSVGALSISQTLLVALLFLAILSSISWFSAPLATSEPRDRIALLFCGSQKTLATGIPVASVIFAHIEQDATGALGLIILPVMCYHPLQLLVAGALTPYLAKTVARA